MTRVRAFFVQEASECLDTIRSELSAPAPDLEALHRAARRLRGSAQMARFGALADEAAVLEREWKAAAGTGRVWDPEESQAPEVVASLETDIEAVRDGRIEQDERKPMTDEQVETGAEPGVDGGAGAGSGHEVPLDALEYRGTDALARAEELREPLEDAIVAGEPPGALLDEVFDLIRLGRK